MQPPPSRDCSRSSVLRLVVCCFLPIDCCPCSTLEHSMLAPARYPMLGDDEMMNLLLPRHERKGLVGSPSSDPHECERLWGTDGYRSRYGTFPLPTIDSTGSCIFQPLPSMNRAGAFTCPDHRPSLLAMTRDVTHNTQSIVFVALTNAHFAVFVLAVAPTGVVP